MNPPIVLYYVNRIVVLGVLVALVGFYFTFSTTNPSHTLYNYPPNLACNCNRTESRPYPRNVSLSKSERWRWRADVPAKQNVFYLRVHKTGSSTLTGTFNRYILRHGLSYYIQTDHPYFYAGGIKEAAIPYERAGKPLLAPLHAIYDKKEVGDLMGGDYSRIASIRDPLTHLPSVIYEFASARSALHQLKKNWTAFDDADRANHFLANLEKMTSMNIRTGVVHPMKNLMAQLFGGSFGELDQMDYVRSLLQNTSSAFDLVMLTEKFDESLVLLRRKLGWEMNDIIYLTKRTTKMKKNPVTPENAKRHKTYNRADYVLYDFFKKKFLQDEMVNFGPIDDELVVFREILTKVKEFCGNVMEMVSKNPKNITVIAKEPHFKVSFEPGPWGRPFDIHAMDCVILLIDSNVMNNIYLVKQRPDICQAHFDKDAGLRRKPGLSQVIQRYCTKYDTQWGLPLDAISYSNSFV